MAASSDNLAASIDPFLLRHSFSDYFWLTPAGNDSFSKSIYDDHDFNTLLLQQKPDHHHQYNLNHQQQHHQWLSPFSSYDLEQNQYKPPTTHLHPLTPSSDPETSTTPRRRATTTSSIALNGKPRIAKRKSRATKRNQTTFIAADPANFRQMVQQVTGIRFDSTSSTLPPSLSHFLKPEIRRPVGRLYNACLPTLDTSSCLLDQSQSLISDRSIYGAGGLNSVHVGAGAQSGNGGESDYGASDGFACFPTLESWKVM